jgi:hypothetical protein
MLRKSNYNAYWKTVRIRRTKIESHSPACLFHHEVQMYWTLYVILKLSPLTIWRKSAPGLQQWQLSSKLTLYMNILYEHVMGQNWIGCYRDHSLCARVSYEIRAPVLSLIRHSGTQTVIAFIQTCGHTFSKVYSTELTIGNTLNHKQYHLDMGVCQMRYTRCQSCSPGDLKPVKWTPVIWSPGEMDTRTLWVCNSLGVQGSFFLSRAMGHFVPLALTLMWHFSCQWDILSRVT